MCGMSDDHVMVAIDGQCARVIQQCSTQHFGLSSHHPFFCTALIGSRPLESTWQQSVQWRLSLATVVIASHRIRIIAASPTPSTTPSTHTLLMVTATRTRSQDDAGLAVCSQP